MKRLVVDVDETFHAKVIAYAKRDRRMVRQIALLAIERYMKQNPSVYSPEEYKDEKDGSEERG